MKKQFVAKIAFLSLLVFNTLLFPVSVFYKKYRFQMKDEMYRSQLGLMKEGKYKSFIEPYLQEAEVTLRCLQYCQKNNGSDVCVRYMHCLQNYNASYFINMIRNSFYTKCFFDRCNEQLRECIEAIKEEGNLEDLDIDQELKKTFLLIHKANEAYYKKLGLGAKMFLGFKKFSYL